MVDMQCSNYVHVQLISQHNQNTSMHHTSPLKSFKETKLVVVKTKPKVEKRKSNKRRRLKLCTYQRASKEDRNDSSSIACNRRYMETMMWSTTTQESIHRWKTAFFTHFSFNTTLTSKPDQKICCLFARMLTSLAGSSLFEADRDGGQGKKLRWRFCNWRSVSIPDQRDKEDKSSSVNPKT